jgi:hypothetical protein
MSTDVKSSITLQFAKPHISICLNTVSFAICNTHIILGKEVGNNMWIKKMNLTKFFLVQ